MNVNKELIRQIIWEAVICNPNNVNFTTEDIGYDTDFVNSYEIPSIQIVATVAKLEEEYDTELKISDIYRLRTINEIAEYIESNAVSVKNSIEETIPEKSIDDLFEEL